MFTVTTAVAFILGSGVLIMANDAAATTSPGIECPTILNHRFLSINGKPQDLCQYRGKVLLVVNTASYCGYTEQYKGLQSLYDKYQSRGLVVLGFPANDFGKQEPGSNADVADFCERTFKVRFPMTEKTSVIEGQANPFYEALFKRTGERPKWNFHKFLVGRNGKTIKSFPSGVAPESSTLMAEVEALLLAK